MTELRDARLRRAMDAAPDAGLRPPARMRDAIRVAALGAVQPVWRRWWPRVGQGRTPWAAAFATLVLAGFIGLLWQGREVPGARDLPTQADQPVPAPVAPAATGVDPPAPPAAKLAPPVVRSPVAPPKERARERQPASRSERAADELASAPAPPPQPAAAPAAPPPPPPVMGDAVQESRAAAAAPMAQRAPAPAATLRAAPSGPAWSQVRIEADGRSVVVQRAQAGRLPSLLARMLSGETDEPPAAGAASMRLDLQMGLLEKAGEQWRWTREGQPARALRVEPALAAAVQEEAERLLRP